MKNGSQSFTYLHSVNFGCAVTCQQPAGTVGPHLLAIKNGQIHFRPAVWYSQTIKAHINYWAINDQQVIAAR